MVIIQFVALLPRLPAGDGETCGVRRSLGAGHSASPPLPEGELARVLPRQDAPAHVKTTRYFTEQVLRKRPVIQRGWCERALREPLRREVQLDGRIRYWIFIPEVGKYLRVVTTEDGETVHNAFFDRDFKEVKP